MIGKPSSSSRLSIELQLNSQVIVMQYHAANKYPVGIIINNIFITSYTSTYSCTLNFKTVTVIV